MKNIKLFIKLFIKYLLVTVFLVTVSVSFIEIMNLAVSLSEIESEIIKKIIKIVLLFALIFRKQNKVSQKKKLRLNEVIRDLLVTVGSWFAAMLCLIFALIILFLLTNNSKIIDFSPIHTFNNENSNILTHFLSVGILTPVYEELFFRDYLYRTELVSKVNFILISIIFSLAHVDFIGVPMTFVFSMHCFNMRKKHGNVITCILAHVIINSFGVLASHYLQNALLIFISITIMFGANYLMTIISKRKQHNFHQKNFRKL